jgi:hypothetical protein
MSEKVRLTGLGIEVKSGKLDLTIDEARELYQQLHKLFGERSEKIIYVDRWHYNYPPYWTQTLPDYRPVAYPLITCQTISGPEGTYGKSGGTQNVDQTNTGTVVRGTDGTQTVNWKY